MKMKNAIKIIILLPIILTAQSVKKDTLQTGEIPLNFATFFNPLTHLEDPFFPERFEMLEINTNILNDTTSLWMKTRLQLAYMHSSGADAKANILNPLYKQYRDSQNMRLLKQILGAVQIGAVGFLAYQHIKKYGFLKKKDSSD